MRDQGKRHWPWIAGFGLAYGALALAVDNSYYQLILTVVLVWAVMGLAWNLLSGYSGLISFGHAAFFGLGAYFVVIAQIEWALTPWLGIPLAALVGAVAGLVVGVPTFRLRGHYFALAMLAYPLALLYIFEWLGFQEATIPMRRETPWRFMQFSDGRVYVLLALALLLAAMAVTRLVERSRFGLALAAVKQDETAAEAAGIPTLKWKLRAIVLSGAMAAAAGGFYAVVQLVVTPASVFGMLVSAQALTIAMFGGVGTVWGPVIGALVLVPLSASLDAELADVLPGIQGVVYGVAIIAVILLAPEGLFWKLRDRFAALRERARDRDRDRGAASVHAERDTAYETDAGAQRFAVAPAATDGTPILVVEGLAKFYGGLKAVDDVSLTVRRGEILGIIGPNGAGKTTLFNLMNGLTQPDRGSVRFEGAALRAAPSAVCKRGIARTFQVVKPFRRMTLAANVVVGAYVRARDDEDARAVAAAALAVVGLTHAAERTAGGASNLELRLMELARALASQPKLLLLDEIFAGLTAAEIAQVMDVIRRLAKLGLTVVIIEHTMQAMVQLVDRFVVLDHGAVLATGTPEAVTRDRRVIEAYLGKKWADGTAGIEHVARA